MTGRELLERLKRIEAAQPQDLDNPVIFVHYRHEDDDYPAHGEIHHAYVDRECWVEEHGGEVVRLESSPV